MVLTVGTATVLLGTFLPWLGSGERDRSSYAIFDLVERLGFAPSGVVSWSLRLWPLVPLLLVVQTLTGWAVATGHLRWQVSALTTAMGTAWVGGTAIALVLAPDVGLFQVGSGPIVVSIGIAVAVLGTAWLRRRVSDSSGAA